MMPSFWEWEAASILISTLKAFRYNNNRVYFVKNICIV